MKEQFGTCFDEFQIKFIKNHLSSELKSRTVATFWMFSAVIFLILGYLLLDRRSELSSEPVYFYLFSGCAAAARNLDPGQGITLGMQSQIGLKYDYIIQTSHLYPR